jgi:LysM repeat protein
VKRRKLLAGSMAAAGAAVVFGGFSVSAEEEVTYTVEEGDTMFSISQDHTTFTLEELEEMNPDADPHNLQIGQELTVVTEEEAGSGVETHVVSSGETYYSIASEHDGVSASDLENWNYEIDAYELQEGYHIVVEEPIAVHDASEDGAYHHIAEGENYHSIARQYYDVTAQELIEINHSVYADEMEVGQMIQLDPIP